MADDVRISQGLREVLQSETPAETRHAMVIPSVVVREVLQADLPPPTVDKTMGAVISSLAREVLQADLPPPKDLALMAAVTQLYREILYRMPDFGVAQAFREVLLTYAALPGTTAYLRQEVNQVALSLPVSPLAQVISVEGAAFVSMLTMQQANAMPFPWSLTRVAQSTALVASALPISTQSLTRSPQVMSAVLHKAASGAYLPPTDTQSRTMVGQSVALVLQSSAIPYVPDSKDYAAQVRLLAVQPTDLTAMWTTPEQVGQVRAAVVQSLGTVSLPRSITLAAQVSHQAVSRRTDPMPQSPTRAGAVATQAAIASDMPFPVGVIHGRQSTSQVVQQWIAGMPQGMDRVAQSCVKVAQATPYSGLDAMLAKNRAAQVALDVLIAASYPTPQVSWSNSVYAQAATVYTQVADPAWYMPPSYIVSGSKYTFCPQVAELVAQARIEALPWSRTALPQLRAMAAARADYRPASSVATSGITLSSLTRQVAIADQYDDPHNAQSILTVSQATEQVAQVAEYPTAHISTTAALVGQLVEQAAQADTYPQPDSLRSVNAVKQILTQNAQTDTYPDPLGLHSPLSVGQVAEQVAELCSDYPDKDAPGSAVVIRSVMEQSAELCSYPDKDQPGSRVVVRQMRGQVALTDPTLYVLPKPLRRQRVRIVCRVVYE